MNVFMVFFLSVKRCVRCHRSISVSCIPSPTGDGPAPQFAHRMPELWRAAPKAGLSFELEATAVGFYDLLCPDCGTITVRVDDREPMKKPRFDAYCTYRRIGGLEVVSGLDPGRRTVSVTVDAEPLDKMAIVFEHNRPDMDEHFERYAGA